MLGHPCLEQVFKLGLRSERFQNLPVPHVLWGRTVGLKEINNKHVWSEPGSGLGASGLPDWALPTACAR